MPNKPVVSNLNARSVGILNAIRNNASAEYYNAVPLAEDTTESIRAVGQAITAFQPRMNEFVSALVNRIARVVVNSKLYSNPWAFAKKGLLEYGETIEEIFVDIADSVPFDPLKAETEVFKRNKPNIRSMFHAMNLQTEYPVTISQQQLRQAFLSASGVTDLIARIVNSLYSAANYDEFIMMKYVIAVVADAGGLAFETITAVTNQATAEAAIVKIKENSTLFGFMSDKYTSAGNMTFADMGSVYVITTAGFDALTDVDVMAKAFNIDRANWAGRHVPIDSFAFNEAEITRLGQLLADDAAYQANPITLNGTLNTALGTISAIMMDEQFLQVYDVLNEFTEIYNPKGLYWNEFYHLWKIYSASPFVNVLMFTTTAKSVTAVGTISGDATATAGQRKQYTTTVTAGEFTNKGVIWSITGITGATINQDGLAYFPVAGTATITATSVADPTKTKTKSVTVS